MVNKKTISNSDIDSFIHGSDDSSSNEPKIQRPLWEGLDPNEKRLPTKGKNITLNPYEKTIIEAAAKKESIKPITYMRHQIMKRSKEILGID